MDTPEWLKNYTPNPPGNPSWKKGGPSPNPAGRPKNIKDRRLTVAQALGGNGPKLLQVIVNEALDGNTAAMAMILNRLEPALKARDDKVSFEIDLDSSPAQQARQVLAAIASGDISPDTGKSLLDALGTLAGIVQIDDLAARIAELEAERQE